MKQIIIIIVFIAIIIIIGVVTHIYKTPQQPFNEINSSQLLPSEDEKTNPSQPLPGESTEEDIIAFQSLFKSFVTYPYNDENILKCNLNCYIASGISPHIRQSFTITKKEIPNIHLNYNQHESSKGIFALYETFKDTQTNSHITNIELINNRYIIISTDIPSLRYAVIMRNSIYDDILQGEKYFFNYLPLQGQFFDQNIFYNIDSSYWDINGKSVATYVPYHLFEDDLLFYYRVPYLDDRPYENHNLSHQIGHYYRIDGNITDFKEFYESLDMYEVIEENNKLTLIGDLHKRELSGIDREATPVKGKTILDFKEEDGQRFVTYSFETD